MNNNIDKYSSDEEYLEALNINRKLGDAKKVYPNNSNTELVNDIIQKQEDECLADTFTAPGEIDIDKLNSIYKEDLKQARKKELFYIEDWASKSTHFSDDLKTMMESLEVSTAGDRSGLKKVLLATDLGEEIEKGAVKKLPVVYLGSGVDIAFPLSLRFRNIWLVDPVLNDDRAHETIKNNLEKFGLMHEASDGGVITYSFQFDFGQGKEQVTIKCYPQKAETFQPKSNDKIGGIISYAGGGYTNPFEYSKLYAELSEGGLLYSTDRSFIEENLVSLASGENMSGEEAEAEVKKTLPIACEQYGLRVCYVGGVTRPYYIKERQSLALSKEIYKHHLSEMDDREKREALGTMLREYKKNNNPSQQFDNIDTSQGEDFFK